MKSVKKGLPWAMALLCIAALFMFWQRLPSSLEHEQLGHLRLYPAWLRQHGVMYVLSGTQGWQQPERDAAWHFARAGYYVIGVDTPDFLKHMAHDTDCLYVPGVLEGFSRDQQRRLGVRDYQQPVLVGRGVGGSLVYMAQLQAPPLSFDAAVALNPDAEVHLPQPFCDHEVANRNGDLQTLKAELPEATLPIRIWNDAAASGDSVTLVNAIHAQRVFEPSPGSIFEQYRAALDDIAAEAAHSDVADLPLVEVTPAAKGAQPTFAILYSGDGGWRDLDQTLAGVLADKGMPVVGVDVLRYYWRDKQPKIAAADLVRIVRHYQREWRRERVVLIGFSFGANVLPFLYSRLPVDMQKQVSLITLLSPERTTAFTVDPTNWLGFSTEQGKVAIAPQLQSLPSSAQCIFGEEEADDSLCTLPEARGMQLLRKPGGHHFDENYMQLADDILSAVQLNAR